MSNKFKNILSLLIITAIILLPISVTAELNSGVITDGELSYAQNIDTELQFDIGEDVDDNEFDIIANQPEKLSGYENITALDGIPDYLNRGTITYNLTGGTDGPIPNPAWTLAGDNRPLSTTEPIHDPANLDGEMVDVVFAGWSLTEPSDILTIDDTVPSLVTTVDVLLNENVDVYAVWGFVTLIVEVDNDSNTTITFPMWVDIDYEIDENSDGNITITFPPGTNENNISITVPATWDYSIIQSNNDEIVIIVTPPLPTMHDVTFNLNGGNVEGNTSPIIISIVENTTIGALVPAPTRTNHTFNGWQENGTGQILSSVNVAALTINEPQTFTALWTRNTGVGWVAPPPIPIPPSNETDDPDNNDNTTDETPPEEVPDISEETPNEELPEIEQPSDEQNEPTDDVPTNDSEEIPTNDIDPEEVPDISEETPNGELPEIEQPSGEQDEQIDDAPTSYMVPDEEQHNEIETSFVDVDVNVNNEHTEELQPEEDANDNGAIIIEFTLTDIGNPSNGNIRHFRTINRSGQGLQFLSGEIPAFTHGNGIFYTIRYRTNMTNPPRVMATNVPADRPFSLLPPQLSDGEFVTEIILDFDTIPDGFRLDNTIVYRFTALDENNVINYWEIVSGEKLERRLLISATLYNIDRMSGRENKYDAVSWANLQAVINYVQDILRNPTSTLADVEEAYFLLQQAINELTPVYSTVDSTMEMEAFFVPMEIFIPFFNLMLFLSLILLLLNVLKHKKQTISNSPRQALA